MWRGSLLLFVSSLLLIGCAGMDSKPNIWMDASTTRAAPIQPPLPKPSPTRRAATKVQEAPKPAPVAPTPAPPPHHWYDHLKFWKN